MISYLISDFCKWFLVQKSIICVGKLHVLKFAIILLDHSAWFLISSEGAYEISKGVVPLGKGCFWHVSYHLLYLFIPQLPSPCICGQEFSTTHAFSCSHCAFPILYHNDICDLTSSLLLEVCHDIKVKPPLQPLTSEACSTGLQFAMTMLIWTSGRQASGVFVISRHFLMFYVQLSCSFQSIHLSGRNVSLTWSRKAPCLWGKSTGGWAWQLKSFPPQVERVRLLL